MKLIKLCVLLLISLNIQAVIIKNITSNHIRNKIIICDIQYSDGKENKNYSRELSSGEEIELKNINSLYICIHGCFKPLWYQKYENLTETTLIKFNFEETQIIRN